MSQNRMRRDPGFDPVYVRDISEAVYRDRLGADDTASMIEKDGDAGQKLRDRASSYDTLTRSYLRTLGFTPPVDHQSTAASSAEDSEAAGRQSPEQIGRHETTGSSLATVPRGNR